MSGRATTSGAYLSRSDSASPGSIRLDGVHFLLRKSANSIQLLGLNQYERGGYIAEHRGPEYRATHSKLCVEDDLKVRKRNMEHKPTTEQLRQARPELGELDFLGEGGFKAVYRAKIRGRIEAVKVVYIPREAQGNASREEIIARVRREIGALERCHTNRLVALGSLALDAISIDVHDYFIYSEELLPGESLRQHMHARPDAQQLERLMRCLMEALRAIEQSGHIHRDIKPDNVMVTGLPERPFVVLDLGIAFKMHGTELTARGAGPPGTVIYMAPELFQPDYKDVLDIRSDIYSAGVTVFEYAAGQHPFYRPGERDYTTVYRILHQQPAKLADLRGDLPVPLCRMVDRCFRRLPALRYPNPAAALRELEALI
jgi:serine/threonine protein kinase